MLFQFTSRYISLYISQSLTNMFIRDFRFIKRVHISSVLNGGGGGGGGGGGRGISNEGAVFPGKFAPNLGHIS